MSRAIFRGKWLNIIKEAYQMDYLYAQLDENNICMGISQLSGEVTAANMIRLTEPEFTIELIGCEYLGSGEWGERHELV